MEPFLGEVRLLPFNFAPKDWLACNGQLLPISRNSALFSLLGTMYGGDGKTTFAVPNLNGCVVVGAGQGPGLQPWSPGDENGADSVALTMEETPAHNHTLGGLDVTGSAGAPKTSDYLGQDRRGGSGNVDFLAPNTTTVDASMDPRALGLAGGSQPHENRQPFVALQYCIAIQGIFPQRP